jgi:hypothetical protein
VVELPLRLRLRWHSLFVKPKKKNELPGLLGSAGLR